MIICPECSNDLAEPRLDLCPSCGWKSSAKGGIKTFFRSSDLTDPTLVSYFENYDELAETDLKVPIVDESFVRNLAQNVVGKLGDVSGLSVGDVGSGKGFAARMLASRGAHVSAIDISAAYLQAMRAVKDLKPFLANAENLPFRNHFDVIVSTDVMEHVLNLGSFLYSVNRALKQRGRFIVRVPYREDLLTYSPHFGCPYRFVHLRTFNRGSLTDCLIQSGFKIKSIRLDGFFWGKAQPAWFSGLGLGRLYKRIQRYVTAWGVRESDVTLHSPLLLWFLMKPSMILADVEKVVDLETARKMEKSVPKVGVLDSNLGKRDESLQNGR